MKDNFSPNQQKILAVLKNGPYPEHLLAHFFPYVGPTVKLQGKRTNGSFRKVGISIATLEEKGVVEEHHEPNDPECGCEQCWKTKCGDRGPVRYWKLKGWRAA